MAGRGTFGRLWQRIQRVRREVGLLGAVRRVVRNRNPIHRGLAYEITPDVLAAAQLPDPGDLVTTRYDSWDEIPGELRQVFEERDSEPQRRDFECYFADGSTVWIGLIDGALAGVCWRTRPRDRGRYFVPLTKTEAIIYACFVLPGFRGRNIYPRMLQRQVAESFEDGLTRVYINCKRWNTPSVRGIQKAGFRAIGGSWICVFRGRARYFWNNCPQA
ncbi:MAG: GNAT family N-acetyltransferase [Planctomycetota bacterium]